MNQVAPPAAPTNDQITLAIIVLLSGGLLVYGALWTLLIGRRPFPHWVRFVPRPAASWNGIDALVAFGLYFVLQAGFAVVVGKLIGQQPGNGEPMSPAVLAAAGVGGLLSIGLSCLLICARTQSTAAELGWAGPWGRDLLLGCGAFLLLAPPVYLVQTVLALLLQPSQHPLITRLQESPDAAFFAAAGFMAAIVAPICEEFVFRGLLQGWLESLGAGSSGDRKMTVETDGEVSNSFAWPAGASRTPVIDSPMTSETNPYAAPGHDHQAIDANATGAIAAGDAPRSLRTSAPWWPILVSSSIFAAMHFHGTLDPDPIALFLLALGLGYLYRQTHRLLPCIVVHMLLNGSSMVMLGLSLWG